MSVFELTVDVLCGGVCLVRIPGGAWGSEVILFSLRRFLVRCLTDVSFFFDSLSLACLDGLSLIRLLLL